MEYYYSRLGLYRVRGFAVARAYMIHLSQHVEPQLSVVRPASDSRHNHGALPCVRECKAYSIVLRTPALVRV